jgi:hypothetical protein
VRSRVGDEQRLLPECQHLNGSSAESIATSHTESAPRETRCHCCDENRCGRGDELVKDEGLMEKLLNGRLNFGPEFDEPGSSGQSPKKKCKSADKLRFIQHRKFIKLEEPVRGSESFGFVFPAQMNARQGACHS